MNWKAAVKTDVLMVVHMWSSCHVVVCMLRFQVASGRPINV